MSDKLKFARDFPEVCDLWKSFDMRPRYNADNMMQAYCAGYAARAESRADQPAPTETAARGTPKIEHHPLCLQAQGMLGRCSCHELEPT